MFTRNDLTLSMFYSSQVNEETGNKEATLTLLALGPEGESLHSTQLKCVTDTAKKKSYSVGEQMIVNGSDPLLVAVENYWRGSVESATKSLLAETMEFIAGNISSASTWVGQYGIKVFENVPLAERLPESVLQADGGVAPAPTET